MRKLSLGSFASAWVLVFASTAAAGPVERMAKVIFGPSDPDVVVLKYENGGGGLLYSDDGGRSFRLMCASSINPMTRAAGVIGVTGDGPVLMGQFDGMWQDDGRGCGWTKVPAFEGEWVTDIVAHPTDPTLAFAITSTGSGAMNGVFRREASGQWSPLGVRAEMLISRLQVVSTPQGLRFYQSAARVVPPAVDGGIPETAYVIRVSDDEGESWQEFPFTGDGTGGSLRLEAVDPTNPDRIVILVDRSSEADTVMMSTDRGASFVAYLTVTDFGGIALAPDGRVWIGESGTVADPNASKGLWFASSLDAPAAKQADYAVECVSFRAATDALYACQPYSFGEVDAASGTFDEIIRFADMQQFVACEGVDVAATCETQLCRDYCGPGHFAQAPVCCAYDTAVCGPLVAESEGMPVRCSDTGPSAGSGGLPAVDSGMPGPSAGAGGGTTPPEEEPPQGDDGGCGCRALGHAPTPTAWPVAIGILGWIVGAWRRRRRTRA